MQVIVELPDGTRVQGANLRVTIPGILGYAGYSKTVTTDPRGIAIVPDPGPTALGRSASIEVYRFRVGVTHYEYHGEALTNMYGKFPREYTAVCTGRDAPEELTGLQQATRATIILVLGMAAIASVITLGRLVTYKHRGPL
jgi:hypothetical protein